MCTWSMQYVLLLFHIILKFTFYWWRVPRSSVDRALYRESGPSRDADPVSGNLPFYVLFLFFFNFSFWKVLFFFECVKIKKKTWRVLVYPSFYFITSTKVFFHLMTSLPFSYTLESGTSIEMLLNQDVINSINNFFCRKLILESNHSAFHRMFVRLIYAVCTPLVPYSLNYSPFMASSPQLSG